MERLLNTLTSPENMLVQKYGLMAGAIVALEKVATHSRSQVPIGNVQKGTLKDTVSVGSPISFLDNSGSISRVEKIEEQHGKLFIYTQTSTYILNTEKEKKSSQDFEWDDIEMVETSKGSMYRYLTNGNTQRFKKVEGREYEPQTALVYVPNFEWVRHRLNPQYLAEVFKDEHAYENKLLLYIQNPLNDNRSVYIVDAVGKKIETNEEIRNIQGQVYLAFLKDGKTDFIIPVSHKPALGFYTFDTRTYNDEKTGQRMREQHLGNQVIKIILKKGSKSD